MVSRVSCFREEDFDPALDTLGHPRASPPLGPAEDQRTVTFVQPSIGVPPRAHGTILEPHWL